MKTYICIRLYEYMKKTVLLIFLPIRQIECIQIFRAVDFIIVLQEREKHITMQFSITNNKDGKEYEIIKKHPPPPA